MDRSSEENMALDSHEIEAIKTLQDIIRRMADNSARTKSIFVVLSVAVLTMSGGKIPTIPVLIGYLIFTTAMWYMDARYLQLERAFREIHKSIVKRDLQGLEMWSFDVDPYIKKVQSIPGIMFENFTMWVYWIPAVGVLILLLLQLFTTLWKS